MSISPQFRIASLYVALASLWIWLSDRALAVLVHDPLRLTWAQSIKGWVFVALTGVVLYWLIGRDLKRLAATNRQLVHGHEQALRVLVSAMDIRHKETRDHSDRVMRMAMGLARLTGMQDDALLALKFGALLHDIGKLAIPDAILIKPGKLDEAEMEHMRRHPEIGRELMEQVDFLRNATDIPYAHHERWDGTGYPRGLRGEEIPLAARIFSIVDVWDALSFPRVYKPAWPEDEVLAYLRNAAGSQLDPQLVQLFLDNYRQIKALGMVDATVPMQTAHA
ncbi:HD-GYP domain-containing protein [Frateuria terrea]|uniref:HDIG domain-containing protein n=1 Tax=Frateuria terrea TaxID=529704 RepID=A0A1H6Q8Q6_9GAMM|nr:HD-GYP domain-containing protein [Frateuria terrea]SEI38236.1 HDIG domain-containing protein [Frateuria terrea]SFP03777.1 HDIG domain-containing protein [Frateuria terrea]